MLTSYLRASKNEIDILNINHQSKKSLFHDIQKINITSCNVDKISDYLSAM